MKLLLLANTLFESLLAVVLVFFPGLLFLTATEQTLQTLRVLAGNAVGFAALSLVLMRTQNPQVLKPGLIALASFHTAVVAAQLANSVTSGTFNPAVVPHVVFAVGFLLASINTHRAAPLPNRLQS